MLTPSQLKKYLVLGIPTDTETLGQKDFDALAVTKVHDINDKELRQPILIRIENVGTEPIFYSEDIVDADGNGVCSADAFTGIISPASAALAGDGGFREWQKHRPKQIYIFGTNAYSASISKRYAQGEV